MLTLCFNYYRDDVPARNAELRECLQRNCFNPEIDHIAAITEVNARQSASHPKLSLTPGKRATFNQLLRLTQPRSEDITVLANSDMYFSVEGLRYVKQHLRPYQAYALTRWEVNADGSTAMRNDELADMSQDAWMFRGPIRQMPVDFCLGIPGCDNRFAAELAAAGYEVTNPTSRVPVYHLHLTNIRHYAWDDDPLRLRGDYLAVQPT